MEFLVVFGFVVLFLGSAWGGRTLRKSLHESHLTSETMESIRLVTGLMVTFAALILSLQLSSARARFDQTSSDRSTYAARLAALDQCLRIFGDDVAAVRLKLRQYAAAVIGSTWPHEARPQVEGMPSLDGMAIRGESSQLSRLMAQIGSDIDGLPPSREHAATRCRAAFSDVITARWKVIESAHAPSDVYFVGLLAFWLSLVFVSLGLQIPTRKLTSIVLVIGIMSISTVMFVIVDLSLPYRGVFHIPSDAMRDALGDMLR